MLPLFIGGHPRSGTTLLGAMIGVHSTCICTPESPFKTDVFNRLATPDKEKIDIRMVMSMIKSHWRFRIWGLEIGSIPEDEVRTYQELIKWIVRAYARNRGKPDPGIWVDHTPQNIKYADILFSLFPESKMIHIVRDGRAVAASIMPLDWGANSIDRAAHSWVRRVSLGLIVELGGMERVRRVRYEDLVQEPEETMKGLSSFLKIEYQPRMVEGIGFKVPPYTIRQHSLIGQRPEAGRINAWERELKPRQIEIFESIAGDLLLRLGYDLKYGLKAKKMTRREKLILDIEDLFKRKVINRLRKKYRKHRALFTANRLLT
ncbi:MAG: sulfotransferase [Nitrospirota bacterium]